MPPTIKRLIGETYEIHPEDLRELAKIEAKGRVYVHAEHDLSKIGKKTGLFDVASQCACGDTSRVLMCDLDAIHRETGQAVDLRVYFVEREQFEASRREKARKQSNQEAERRHPHLNFY
jgi:hypothetical protein